jgi:hypothetical protein
MGTGRIALPLQARGVDVDGTDFSAAMIEQLRAKPAGASISTRVGDMTAIDMGRSYGLVYLVFNTIGNVMTQDAQVACFRNAASHLERVFDNDDAHVGIDHYTDLAEQQAVSRHFPFDGDVEAPGVGVKSVRYGETPFRFVWPSELDLMAGESTAHVSVWRKS